MIRRPKGCVYERGSVLWIKYSRHGRSFRESTGLSLTGDEKKDKPTRKKAEQKLEQRLAEITTGTFTGLQVQRIRVDELADDFIREYRINGKRSIADAEARWKAHLKPIFAGMRAIDVTSGLIARYVDARQHARAANATINRELAALKRMFYLGYRSTPPKVLRVPAFPHLDENKPRAGFLTDAQRDALASECAKVGLWLRAIFELGCTFGWRISEVKGLRVRHLDVAAC